MSDNTIDSNRLMKVTKIAQELKEASDREIADLQQREFIASAGSLMVKVRMAGNGKVRSIDLDPDYISTHTADQISKDIVSALNRCKQSIDDQMAEIVNKYNDLTRERMMKAYMDNDDDPDRGDGM